MRVKKTGFGIYIHWPFCLAKCPYCDFNSHVAEDINQKNWRIALVKEIEYYANKLNDKQVVTSIFFGGGTPSLMPASTVAHVIGVIKELWEVADDVEITLEANPTSVESEKFRDFAEVGINRVSLGVQSLRDDELKFLGRKHSAKEAVKALEIAREYFDRTSFDLIYARPNQTIDAWREELEEALALAQGHISLYQLTIEKGTQFYTLYQRGDLQIPSDDEGAALYELTTDMMEKSGYNAYEVSNYAQKGQESKHNLVYWRYGDYLGIGPGAHGRITIGNKKYATKSHRAPDVWRERVMLNGTGAHGDVLLSPKECTIETLLMGLRLLEPIYLSDLKDINIDILKQLNVSAIRKLQDGGFLVKREDALQITPSGRQCLESLLPQIFI